MPVHPDMPVHRPVSPRSLAAALAHVRSGGRLAIPTSTRCIIIDSECLARFESAGEWLLREDGDGYRIRRGRRADYIFPGGLVFA